MYIERAPATNESRGPGRLAHGRGRQEVRCDIASPKILTSTIDAGVVHVPINGQYPGIKTSYRPAPSGMHNGWMVGAGGVGRWSCDHSRGIQWTCRCMGLHIHAVYIPRNYL